MLDTKREYEIGSYPAEPWKDLVLHVRNGKDQDEKKARMRRLIHNIRTKHKLWDAQSMMRIPKINSIRKFRPGDGYVVGMIVGNKLVTISGVATSSTNMTNKLKYTDNILMDHCYSNGQKMTGEAYLHRKYSKFLKKLNRFEAKVYQGSTGFDIAGPVINVLESKNMVYCLKDKVVTPYANLIMKNHEQWYDRSLDYVSVTCLMILAKKTKDKIVYEVVQSVDGASNIYVTRVVSKKFLSDNLLDSDIISSIARSLTYQEKFL